MQSDLREALAAALDARASTVAADAATLFPYTSVEGLDVDASREVAQRLVGLLAAAIRHERADATSPADLRDAAGRRAVSLSQLFAFAYHVERAALDELSLSETLGATTEAWPLVAQLVRRASFDLLASFAERSQPSIAGAPIADALTTLYTRALFDIVLDKEAERAGRYGYAMSLILIAVDGLDAITHDHGVGTRDRLLERLGVVVRTYFRQHDWVARHSDEVMAVLLTRSDVDHAVDLTERLRATVEERLGFVDHRSDQPVAVTISAAVVSVRAERGGPIDVDRLVTEAEYVLAQMRRSERNKVIAIDGSRGAPVPTDRTGSA